MSEFIFAIDEEASAAYDAAQSTQAPKATATPEPTPFPYDTSPYETLTEGMTGDAVQKLKKAMYWLGYFNSENLSDEYNEVTVNRVRQLQKANGLPETGEARGL